MTYEGQVPDQYYSTAILENNESCDYFMEDQFNNLNLEFQE